MKYQKHYLGEKGNEKYCPLKRGVPCDSICAWFDHENLDCKFMGSLLDINYELRHINENTKGDKDDKRKFKF